MTVAALPLFHVSNKKFDAFEKQWQHGPMATDMGFHFGTLETAKNIIHQIKKGQGRDYKEGDQFYLYHVELNIKKPLHLNENRLGSWSAVSVLQEVLDNNPPPEVTEEMIEDWEDGILKIDGYDEDAWDEATVRGDEEKQQELVYAFIRQLGYDSIKYENKYEGGGISYLTFDPHLINIKKREPMNVVEALAAKYEVKANPEEPYFGTVDNTNWIINIEGVDNAFPKKQSFGNQLGNLKKFRDFTKTAKSKTINTKGKASLPTIKREVLFQGYNQFAARWSSDASGTKSDVIVVYYKD